MGSAADDIYNKHLLASQKPTTNLHITEHTIFYIYHLPLTLYLAGKREKNIIFPPDYREKGHYYK